MGSRRRRCARPFGALPSATRDAMRRLRSALVEIHPPSLQAAGLEAALTDIVAPLSADDVETTIDVTDEPLPEDVERLFYRAAGEAVRNVRRHAGASNGLDPRFV